MAEDVVNDNFTGDNDPLNEPQSGSEGQAATEGGVSTQTDEGAQAQPALIEGTPFKDQTALISGYKNIQRSIAEKDSQLKLQAQQLADMQRKLDAAAQAIKEHFGQPTLPQGDAFWQEMAKNPVDLINKVATQAFERMFAEKYGTRLEKSEQSLTQIQRESLVNRFLANHPDFTEEDENAMVEILNQRPYLKDLPDGDGIEIAYNMVQAGKYQSTSRTKDAENAVAGAKGVAGLGGKKSAAPAQARQGDEFDEVLALDKAERDTFNLGRRA